MQAVVVVSLALLSLTLSVFAVCPNRKAVDNLDIAQFAGRWYGISGPERFANTYKCGFQDFLPRGAGVVNWKIHYLNTTNSEWPLLQGEMAQINTTGQFQGFRIGLVGGVRWLVLGTDYHRWAAIWQCHESNDVEYGFVLSRERIINPQLLKEAEKLLPKSSYAAIDQSGCSPTLPVLLPLVHAIG